MEVKIKKFQAAHIDKVKEHAKSLNGKILDHIICLVLIDPQNNHWKTEVINFLTDVDEELKSGKFNYEWYFNVYSDISESGLRNRVYKILDKENSPLLKNYRKLDLTPIYECMRVFMYNLITQHNRYLAKRYLSRDEVNKCLEGALDQSIE